MESIAYTPILEEDVYVPANFTVLDGSTQVYTTDGETGRLHSLRVQDDTERIESIIVTSGFIFENPLVVPFEGPLLSLQQDSIVLNVPRSALRDLDGD